MGKVYEYTERKNYKVNEDDEECNFVDFSNSRSILTMNSAFRNGSMI
jgi:hypothetical protein